MIVDIEKMRAAIRAENKRSLVVRTACVVAGVGLGAGLVVLILHLTGKL
jgi:hypothetical protein